MTTLKRYAVIFVNALFLLCMFYALSWTINQASAGSLFQWDARAWAVWSLITVGMGFLMERTGLISRSPLALIAGLSLLAAARIYPIVAPQALVICFYVAAFSWPFTLGFLWAAYKRKNNKAHAF